MSKKPKINTSENSHSISVGQFVKITELKKGRFNRDAFIGKVTSVSNEFITAFVVDESEPKAISPEHFELDQYLVEEVCEAEVLQYFTIAIHKRKEAVIQLEFDIENEKRKLARTQLAYSSVFSNKEVEG